MKTTLFGDVLSPTIALLAATSSVPASEVVKASPVIQPYKNPAGDIHNVTAFEAGVASVRASVRSALKEIDPEGYEAYREIKYRDGDNPSLAQRREAYLFAFARLLAVGYTVPGL